MHISRERPYRSSSSTNGVMGMSVCCVVTFNVKLDINCVFLNYTFYELFVQDLLCLQGEKWILSLFIAQLFQATYQLADLYFI